MENGGIKKSKIMNHALLAEIGWRINHNNNMAWAKMLQHKYLRRTDLLEAPRNMMPNYSTSWRGITCGVKLLGKETR